MEQAKHGFFSSLWQQIQGRLSDTAAGVCRVFLLTGCIFTLVTMNLFTRHQAMPVEMPQALALDITYRTPGHPFAVIDSAMWIRDGAVQVDLMIKSLMSGNCSGKPQYIEFKVPRGRTMPFRLPDGSVAHINADTRMQVPCDFGQRTREVELTGEAFFNITADANKQFIVHSGKIDVLVLGTSFNINNYTDNPSAQVAVSTGKVLLISRQHKAAASPETVVLSAGKCGTINRLTGAMSIAAFNKDEITGWRHGLYICKQKKMEEICRLAERAYNERIRIDSPGKVKYQISVTFRRQRDITYLLEELRESDPSIFFYRDTSRIIHLGKRDK